MNKNRYLEVLLLLAVTFEEIAVTLFVTARRFYRAITEVLLYFTGLSYIRCTEQTLFITKSIVNEGVYRQ
jgi:hypothetical protein